MIVDGPERYPHVEMPELVAPKLVTVLGGLSGNVSKPRLWAIA